MWLLGLLGPVRPFVPAHTGGSAVHSEEKGPCCPRAWAGPSAMASMLSSPSSSVQWDYGTCLESMLGPQYSGRLRQGDPKFRSSLGHLAFYGDHGA